MVILRYDGDLDFDREFQEYKQQETKKGKKKTLEELKAISESFEGMVLVSIVYWSRRTAHAFLLSSY